ncbi:MAG TPA: HAD-IA family hydrolase [Candidatus Krumholzibacteria bacterium]|nr:HAD-IA family hydrolase [Candidatus Krumholzibacteria bacterium]HRX50863.1 HAD-IA family hydrolase [Candidatus Krumholzibacteria bacterium]
MTTAKDERPIQAVIFDLDNTLTDFMLAKEAAVRAAAEAMIDAGLPGTPEEIRNGIFAVYDAVGIEHQRVFDRYLTERTGRVDDQILAAAVVAYRRAREASLVPYPHVRPVLHRLAREGYALAVVSDAPRFEAWLRLTYLRLNHDFDVVLTFDDTGHHKPSPVGFEMALQKLGVPAHRAVNIGDWPERDIVGGTIAGMHTVYARYGDTYQSNDRKERGPSGAHFEIDNLRQLLDVLDELNARLRAARP